MRSHSGIPCKFYYYGIKIARLISSCRINFRYLRPPTDAVMTSRKIRIVTRKRNQASACHVVQVGSRVGSRRVLDLSASLFVPSDSDKIHLDTYGESDVTCHGDAKQVHKNANEPTSRRRFYLVFLSLAAAFPPPLRSSTRRPHRGVVFFSFSASDSRVPEGRNKGASKKTFP